MIQQLSEPSGVPQKEPAHQCLKSRGLAIRSRIAAAGTPAGPVATPPHPVPLIIVEQGIQPGQGRGLGPGANLLDNGPVQRVAAPRFPAVTQALMQFPDRIPEPGELQGTQFGSLNAGGRRQPVGRSRALLPDQTSERGLFRQRLRRW
jgi:hypothetical protein